MFFDSPWLGNSGCGLNNTVQYIIKICLAEKVVMWGHFNRVSSLAQYIGLELYKQVGAMGMERPDVI